MADMADEAGCRTVRIRSGKYGKPGRAGHIQDSRDEGGTSSGNSPRSAAAIL
jgi:hypothetical protein